MQINKELTNKYYENYIPCNCGDCRYFIKHIETEKPRDYGGPFKNYGGGWLWGIDHCYDPRTNHSDAV